MTDKEAREIIKQFRDRQGNSSEDVEAFDMAIKALEQQPCEDYISRRAVKDKLMESWTKYMPMELDAHLSFVLEKISELPSVTPSYNSIKTELDCISRGAVIQIIENKLNPCTDMFKCLEMSEIKEDVEHLSSVTPKTDVFDKIRAEIDQKQYDFMANKDYDEGIRFGLMLAYQIINKYKAEREEV